MTELSSGGESHPVKPNPKRILLGSTDPPAGTTSMGSALGHPPPPPPPSSSYHHRGGSGSRKWALRNCLVCLCDCCSLRCFLTAFIAVFVLYYLFDNTGSDARHASFREKSSADAATKQRLSRFQANMKKDLAKEAEGKAAGDTGRKGRDSNQPLDIEALRSSVKLGKADSEDGRQRARMDSGKFDRERKRQSRREKKGEVQADAEGQIAPPGDDDDGGGGGGGGGGRKKPLEDIIETNAGTKSKQSLIQRMREEATMSHKAMDEDNRAAKGEESGAAAKGEAEAEGKGKKAVTHDVRSNLVMKTVNPVVNSMEDLRRETNHSAVKYHGRRGRKMPAGADIFGRVPKGGGRRTGDLGLGDKRMMEPEDLGRRRDDAPKDERDDEGDDDDDGGDLAGDERPKRRKSRGREGSRRLQAHGDDEKIEKSSGFARPKEIGHPANEGSYDMGMGPEWRPKKNDR